MKNIIIGTAGHIDHGKTSLVKALTGTDTDRLKEEKQRGITIDIGFADLTLGEFRLGFVDVPGHERFVKNMLAGAHGIDLLVLVVAADEAVMPQTREHFEICRLLHIPTGLTVLTKKDLVDDEWLTLATAEVEDFVRGSFLEGKPIIPVSTRTGEGLPELKAALETLSKQAAVKNTDRPPRLPVDRVFTIRGFGTVITGTLVSGRFRVGDEIDILPGDKRTRIRGLEVHGQTANHAEAGQRTAVNLQGLDTADIARGQVAAPAGRYAAVHMLDTRLELLSSAAKPLADRARVRFHHGTSEVMARVSLLGSDSGERLRELAPGTACFAQIRLEEPVLALPGDRFIIRQYSPQITVGGGKILDAMPRRRRANEPGLIPFLKRLDHPDFIERACVFIERAGNGGLTTTELAGCTEESDAVIAAALGESARRNQVVLIEVGTGRRFEASDPSKKIRAVSKASFDGLKTKLIGRVREFHRVKPLLAGIPREEAREQVFPGCAPEVFKAVLDSSVEEKKLEADGETIRVAGRRVEVAGAEAALKERIESVFREAGLQGLTPAEAFERLGLKEAQAKPIYFLLVGQKQLVRVGDFTVHADHVRRLIDDVHAEKAVRGTLDIAFFKDRFGLSRKYAIPLLEYLDAERVTRRVGNVREIL